jgi:hypothetical protein
LLLQLVGSASTLVSYFGVGIPLATVLAFHYRLNAVGLCIGLAVGCYVYMFSTLGIVLCTDWGLEVRRAKNRLGVEGEAEVEGAPTEGQTEEGAVSDATTTPEKAPSDSHTNCVGSPGSVLEEVRTTRKRRRGKLVLF